MSDRAPAQLGRGLWCYRLDESRLVVGGSFSNGGNLHEWLLGTLRLDPDQLDRGVARASASGLTFLPLLAGERSPGFAPRASGAVAGLTLTSGPLALARAAYEGMAVEFAIVDAELDRIWPGTRRLVASGGTAAHSPALLQIVADAVGKPVAGARSAEASSRGAAIFALERLGAWRRRRLEVRVRRTFRPRPQKAADYREAVRRREALYRVLIEQDLLGTAKAAAGALP
jgi:gluconokinase